MPDRLNAVRQNAAPCRVLTMLPTRWHRQAVQAVCRVRDPGCVITDVPSVTDAVLVLLSEPVDLMVVDMGLAGDMLGVLQHHARRSAPRAKMALFKAEPNSASSAATGDLLQGHSWSDMETVLDHLLQDA
ncbi:hypothetical protein ASE31_05920 [Acidovorax sp. Root217]|nr:hypothetical protein ASE31_05920 [Acidovorax sp. Root217]KRC20145.1 hypothetical protein ASE28_28035 [Acidovorax sp. Root219]